MQSDTHSVVLTLQGSHVPSFKNSKFLTRGRLMTSPKNQAWMKAAIDSFASQLLYSFPMSASETVTAQKLRSWIASSLPVNDSCRYLTGCSWNFCKYPKGLEGAQVTITPVEVEQLRQKQKRLDND